MGLYESIKKNLNEFEEVKYKVTFECLDCGYEFSKEFTFDSEEDAENTFDSGDGIDCPKCEGHTIPEEMEKIDNNKKSSKVSKEKN